jgi:hypothetical protein
MNGQELCDQMTGHAKRGRVAHGDADRAASPLLPARTKAGTGPLGPVACSLVIGVWVWSLVEIPWELRGDGSVAQTIALLFSKALLAVLVVCTLRGVRGARLVFTFICAVSIVAIGIDLPIEYGVLRTGFYLSLVDCAIKLAAALMLVSRYANRGRA